LKALEQRLVEAMRRWEDDLHAALVERHGEERAAKLFRVYERAFPRATAKSTRWRAPSPTSR